MLFNCGSGEDSWESLGQQGDKTSQSPPLPHRLFIYLFILLYSIVLVLPYIDLNLPWVYLCSPSWTPLPPPSPSHPSGSSSAPTLSILYYALNLDWRLVSHMIIYMFQCHSPKSSRPLPLPQSPKDCSTHLCLFCCLAYRVIITIFLNSIYMSNC